MHAHRDATAVVQHGNGFVRVQGDLDRVAPAGERLVDAVVDKLDHKVVQAAEVRRPDVHTGPAADRFEAFENLDLVGRVRAFVHPGGAAGKRARVAVSAVRGGLVRHFFGAFGACGVGYR